MSSHRSVSSARRFLLSAALTVILALVPGYALAFPEVIGFGDGDGTQIVDGSPTDFVTINPDAVIGPPSSDGNIVVSGSSPVGTWPADTVIIDSNGTDFVGGSTVVVDGSGIALTGATTISGGLSTDTLGVTGLSSTSGISD